MSIRGSSSNGEPLCEREVIALRNKAKKPKRRIAQKKQRRDYLRRINHLAAATYWVIRIFLLLWDKFTR